MPFKAARLPQQFTDVLVIGGGVAGLRAAIAAADDGADVLVLTKDTIDQSNTWYAQGGIAAVLQPADSYQSHVEDTEKGGAGLCDHAAVDVVIKEGPAARARIAGMGGEFRQDRLAMPHGLAFTREGGHSFARILHAYGDATGKELAQTLIRTVRSREPIRISENSFVDRSADRRGPLRRRAGADQRAGQSDLGQADHPRQRRGGAALSRIDQSARSPPPTATPWPIAPARRCRTWRWCSSIRRRSMSPASSRALITEAVRGEGAYLVDRNGYRFMPDYHEMAELAPRDVVSRAIVEQIRKTHFTHVFLDVRHLPAQAVPRAFPATGQAADRI